MKKLAIILLVLLLGCSIKEGNVTSKEFVPSHSQVYTIYILVGGKVGVPQTRTRTVPDTWYITFQGYDDKGKLRYRTVAVSKEFYDSVDINDYVKVEY